MRTLRIKFPRMKLSNTAVIMVHIPVLLSILHSSSFCYLLIEENMGFAVKLRGKQERPGSVDGRLKPELLLFWALGCDGILAPALQKKKFHNLISSPRLLMPSQMTSEIQAGFLVCLWDQQSCERCCRMECAEGTNGEWAREEKLLGWVRNKLIF